MDRAAGNRMSIGRTAANPIPASQGGLILANSLIRAQIRGDRKGLAITVLSLVEQTKAGNTAAIDAIASTLTSLTVTAATSLVARFGHEDALVYLEGLDGSAEFEAVVSDLTPQVFREVTP